MAVLTEPYKAYFHSIWILSGIENVMLWPERKILSVPSGQDPFDCRCVGASGSDPGDHAAHAGGLA
jgi:hypothetical protein